MMEVLIIREGLTRRYPRPRFITNILFIVRREVRVGGSSPSPFVAQLSFQMINLQLHGSGILLIRKVAPAPRLAPTSIGGMHTNLPFPSSLNVDKMIFMLGPHRFYL